MAENWEKVLYKKQKFPDNYVDVTFLSNVKKNVNLHKYTWWEAFTGIFAVTHEISSTVLFVVTYICMKENLFSIRNIVSTVASLLILCTCVHQWLQNECWLIQKKLLCEHIKSFVLFLTFGYMFSPILKTLTESVSTDTVYAMVALMLIAHVLFQDYGADAAIVSSSLSLNSALFAGVCLASRLPTVQHTFALVVLAVMFFVLLSLIRKTIAGNAYCLLSMTVLFMGIASISLICISVVYAVLFMLLCFCINILFPALFIHCQKYKENIFGPWDEAIVKYQ